MGDLVALTVREQAAYDPCPVNWLRLPASSFNVTRRKNHPDKCECGGTDLRWPTLTIQFFEDQCQPTCVETRPGHHHGRLASPTLEKIHEIAYTMGYEMWYYLQGASVAVPPTPERRWCQIGYDDRCWVTRGIGNGPTDLDAACVALLDSRVAKTAYPPWSPEQVAALAARQQDSRFHPYTCPRSHGPLTPTEAGWRCSECNYVQNWAHGLDADPPRV